MTDTLPPIGRRRFVQGLAAGGALAALGGWRAALAQPARQAAELRGTEFHLEIGETPVNFTGATRVGTTVNGQIPAPLLRWREGDTVTLHVTNRLREQSSIHWHGILLPTDMDGVPGLSFPGIDPGQTYTYRFDVRQSGTYWYHSHPASRNRPACTAPSSSSRAGATQSPSTASTWCCCQTGPTKIR